MTNLKPLKRALLSSVLSIVLCISMLLGTTFAWFTDSVTSAGNTITTGTLDIALYEHTSDIEKREITNTANPLFAGDILWEPGRTEVRYLSLTNNGTLALKYKVVIDVETKNDTHYSLTDVMYYQITPDAQYGDVTAWNYNDENSVVRGRNAAMYNDEVKDVALLPGETHYFALSVHMDEEADNNYQGNPLQELTFDVTILAGQLSYENDSFGNQFDVYAAYPGVAFAPALKENESATELLIANESDGTKLGSVTVPAGAAEDPTKGFEAKMVETDYNHNISIQAGLETLNLDITVSNIKADNTEPVKVQARIPAMLDPATVNVYHKGNSTPLASTYNPETGVVTFETTGFSPFLFVFDAESEYKAPVIDESTPYPQANVVAYTPSEKIVWGSYGQWSPTAGLEANLDAIYQFSCTETLAEAKNNPYANWNCDFYVKLDKDLGANEIFLGGNYGSFGWVGFHNGSLTLKANTEMALLGSVTNNPWTYLDVVQNVGTFICGVGNVGDSLVGATFTVTLRLTNPNNANESVDIQTISYTFQ